VHRRSYLPAGLDQARNSRHCPQSRAIRIRRALANEKRAKLLKALDDDADALMARDRATVKPQPKNLSALRSFIEKVKRIANTPIHLPRFGRKA
jgi:hypothetical protein